MAYNPNLPTDNELVKNLPKAIRDKGGELKEQIDEVEGDVVSHLAKNASDDVHGLAFKGALIRVTANQAIANNTFTFVEFNTAIYDTDDIYDNNEPTRLTVPSGVTKIRLATSLLTQAITGNLIIELYRNGSSAFDGRFYFAQDVANAAHVGTLKSPVLNVSTGDYFEIRMRQIHGDSRDVVSERMSWFAMEVIE